jgi:hypothetical protein
MENFDGLRSLQNERWHQIARKTDSKGYAHSMLGFRIIALCPVVATYNLTFFHEICRVTEAKRFLEKHNFSFFNFIQFEFDLGFLNCGMIMYPKLK